MTETDSHALLIKQRKEENVSFIEELVLYFIVQRVIFRLPGPFVDDRVSSIMRQEKELKCRLLRAASKLQNNSWEFPAGDLPFGGKMDAVRGLRCDINRARDEQPLLRKSTRPLNFIAVDSRVHPEFGWRLGRENDRTFAVIVDLRAESHYVLEKRVSEKSLVQFVKNFTSGALSRAKFDSEVLTGKELDRESQVTGASESFVRVREVTSQTFDEVVTKRQQVRKNVPK
jgi:hypothetical protein